MNRKQLIVLIVSGAIIGALGLVLYSRQRSSWNNSDTALGQKVIANFPLNDVAQVTIKEAAAEVNLVKIDDRWRVKERWNYPANFTELHQLLTKVWELKTVQPVKVGPSQLARLELIEPSGGGNPNTNTNTSNPSTNSKAGTLIEFKDKNGKEIQELLLGKKYVRESASSSPFGGGDYPVGRYVMASGSGSPKVSLVSETFTEVEAKPDRWLNKDFFKVEKLRSISVTSTNTTNSWKIVREKEGGDLKLADKRESEDLDTSKASGVGFALSSPSFNDVVSPEMKAEDLGLHAPRVAVLETFDNFTYTVKIGNKTPEDNYYLTVGVDANLVRERTPGADEKPEDKEKLDKEFQEKLKKLEDKLKQEKEYAGWTYLVSKWTIDPVLKERHELLAEKKPEQPAEKKDETTKTGDNTNPADKAADPLAPLVPPLVPPPAPNEPPK